MRAIRTTLLLSLLLTAALQAEERPPFAPVPPPPPAVAEEQQSSAPVEPGDEELQPEVTIIKRKDALIEEYRHNGRLYMVKITPSKGYPYYLIDTDGDGSLESRRNELDNPPVVQWKILQW